MGQTVRLGFIGTGIISTAVVTGFCESGMEDLQITVSPRTKEKAEALHAKYPDIVSVAADNQEVIDRSDWVFLAVLPKLAEEVLGGLTFPEEKKFINLVSTLSTVRAREIIGDREIIADVVPLTFAAERIGPVVIYPSYPEVVELMSRVGTAIPVQTPKQIAVLRTATALMSSYYMLLTEITEWCVANDVEEPDARRYVTGFTEAMSRKAAGFPEPLRELALEMTPGGLNWRALTHLQEKDAYRPWTEILDPILESVTKE